MVRYTNEKLIPKLKTFIKLIKKKYKIDLILLFGSRARNDYFLSSDIDLIIVSDDFKDIFFSNRIANILEFWNVSIDLEPLCYTKEEFEIKKNQIGLVQQAVKEGIVLN